MAKCIFPGSFDPVTKGHIDIIRRAAAVFEEVTVLLMVNSKKQSMFSLSDRLEILRVALDNIKGVKADSYTGLLTDYCREIDCYNIVRGTRNGVDFEYEMQYFGINRMLEPKIEMFFLPTSRRLLYTSSKHVRELLTYNQDVSELVPKEILPLLKIK